MNACRYVVCDPGGRFSSALPERVFCTDKPIVCFELCVDYMPEIIFMVFIGATFAQRSELLNLCELLRKNRITCEIPIAALLPNPHSELLQQLCFHGTAYLRYPEGEEISAAYLDHIADRPGSPGQCAAEIQRICPYISYSPIDEIREMTTCGAYLNRLVLGKHILKSKCWNEEHRLCDNYLHPRKES